MAGHLCKRALIALLTIFIIITLSFLMVRFMPGDPLIHLVGEENYYYMKEFNPQELERLAEKYAMSGTLGQQYGNYLSSILHLDFGTAYSNNQPVLQNILDSCKWTLILTVPTLLLGCFLGGFLGVLAGWKPGSLFDRITTPIFLFLNTVPTNCIGIIFLVVFAFKLKLFPLNGMTTGGLTGLARFWDIVWHAMLPVMIMVLFRTSSNFLLMKSNVSQIKDEDYTVTARSKGLPERRILFRHVLKNAMLPYITSLCIQVGSLLSGSMMLEVIFGWKGMGQLFYNAVSNRDFPTAQACFIISATCVVLGNWLGDALVAAIDPRIKEGTVHA